MEEESAREKMERRKAAKRYYYLLHIISLKPFLLLPFPSMYIHRTLF